MDGLTATDGPAPLRLRGRLQHYDWGSTTAIPGVLGVEADGRPWAELWLGAHPVAPAEVEVDGVWRPLDGVIAEGPASNLGTACLSRFGPRLPFLVKLLAAARPLSLQVHPSSEQAAEGFAREEAAGTAPGDPGRTYRDPWHKPELICALTPFQALSGFRPPEEAAAVLDAFGLAAVADTVRARGLAAGFWSLWELAPAARAALVAAAAAAAPEGYQPEADLVARLAGLHPGDVGVVAALLLNLVDLAPGDALYAPSGRLHAYLGGLGVEVMATSDNVVRGGLTSKHVDVGELRRILRVEPEEVAPMRPVAQGWPTPSPEFHLSRLDPGQLARAVGPEILLCLDGPVAAVGVHADRGGALFVPAAVGSYRLEGEAPAFRVRVGFLVDDDADR